MSGDPARLRQILVNLIGNALKFTDRGSVEVRVHLARVAVRDQGSGVREEEETDAMPIDASEGIVAASSSHSSSLTPDPRPLTPTSASLHFTVADTGIGIPPEKQRIIFSPFSQADGSTTRKYGGTGLGLSICAQLVELMGGNIWVESRPGHGSQFHFTAQFGQATRLLPPPSMTVDAITSRELELAPAIDNSSGALKTNRPRTILLAEDNAINQKLAAGMLEDIGHRVLIAKTGAEALQMIQRQGVDLVLMDLQMPEMGGLDVTAAVRQEEANTGRHLPIIALTAHAMNGDRQRCLLAGMDDYLSKPIDEAELFAIIERQPIPPSPARPPFDRETFFAHTRGNQKLIAEIVELFLEEAPQLLRAIGQAIREEDADTLRRSAHRLAGSAGNFHAGPVVELARRLEQKAGENAWKELESLTGKLQTEAARLEEALRMLSRGLESTGIDTSPTR